MSKDPSPKADGLRVMREAKFTAAQAPKKKLVPFAGKDRAGARHGGGIPYSKNPKVKK